MIFVSGIRCLLVIFVTSVVRTTWLGSQIRPKHKHNLVPFGISLRHASQVISNNSDLCVSGTRYLMVFLGLLCSNYLARQLIPLGNIDIIKSQLAFPSHLLHKQFQVIPIFCLWNKLPFGNFCDF